MIDADGKLYPAETVIISIGDVPKLSFLPDSVETVSVGGASWIKTDTAGRTSDDKILAVGDVEKPGLATNALGAGKRTAEYIATTLKGGQWQPFEMKVIKYEALTTEHVDDVVPTTHVDRGSLGRHRELEGPH